MPSQTEKREEIVFQIVNFVCPFKANFHAYLRTKAKETSMALGKKTKPQMHNTFISPRENSHIETRQRHASTVA